MSPEATVIRKRTVETADLYSLKMKEVTAIYCKIVLGRFPMGPRTAPSPEETTPPNFNVCPAGLRRAPQRNRKYEKGKFCTPNLLASFWKNNFCKCDIV